MKRVRKQTAVTVLCILIGLPLVCSLALYATAWYHRLLAERLLAATKTLNVGVTTQAEYVKVIRPFVTDADRIRGVEEDDPMTDAYVIATLPEWMFLSTVHLPEPLRSVLSKWAVVEGTQFTVIPTFKDGRLMTIRIAEMQGEGHPFGGFVTVHAGQIQHLSPYDTGAFSGYSGHPMGDNGRVIYTHVVMDDRATPEQRQRALDFRFGCFTAFRLCSDGRQLLDPMITDN
jgi:hypothetical protein